MGKRDFFFIIFSYIAAFLAPYMRPPTTAIAQPRVRVQAGSEVSARWSASSVLDIELNDDRGQPLAHRPLALTVAAPSNADDPSAAATTKPMAQLSTDSSGRAQWQADRPLASEQRVSVHFRGDAFHLPSEVTVEADRSPQQRLRWLEPWSTLDLAQPKQRWLVQLESNSSTQTEGQRQATLTLGKHLLAQAASDDTGLFSFTLDSGSLPTGEFSVDVTVLERGAAPAATLAQTLHAFLRTTLVAAGERHSNGVLVVSGKLRTNRGPAAGQPIDIRRGVEQLATTRTDRQGEFRIELQQDTWLAGDNELPLLAYFESVDKGLRDSRSAPIAIQPAPESSASRLWPWVLSLLCAAAFAIARWRQRQIQPAEAPARSPTLEPIHVAGASAHAQSAPALRVQVSDDFDACPLAAADVTVYRGQDVVATGVTARSGSLHFVLPSAASYRVAVRAAGYLPQSHDIVVESHRENTHLNVALIGTRALIWQAFKPLASQVPTTALRGTVATPEELSRWGQQLCNITLQNLGGEAERSLFGRGAPSPENASRLQRALHRVANVATDREQEQT